MEKTIKLTDGRDVFTYRFLGSPSLLEKILVIFCGLKGLKPLHERHKL